ncbi:hypothetical protein BDV12DRAFT_171253 [Aspergillus spectabilis]
MLTPRIGERYHGQPDQPWSFYPSNTRSPYPNDPAYTLHERPTSEERASNTEKSACSSNSLRKALELVARDERKSVRANRPLQRPRRPYQAATLPKSQTTPRTLPTAGPSISNKRTISEDCTQGPDFDRARKYHLSSERCRATQKASSGEFKRNSSRPSNGSPREARSGKLIEPSTRDKG